MKAYKFKKLLLKSGWREDMYVVVDAMGNITSISQERPQTTSLFIENIEGAAIPGFMNAHSHAFQYGMAGRAELHNHDIDDDFWTWRESMYACALSHNPEEMRKVALNLYRRLLRNGYTHVAEFHYLHHDRQGKPYSNLAETGQAMIQAAAEAGIKITLIPVFYQQGNFSEQANERQRRFICHTVEDYLRLLESSAAAVKYYDQANLGFSVHSLRAVEPQSIISLFDAVSAQLPFHIHAAEQLKEVADCKRHLKQRPVEWILNNLPVNERFNIVHCTHLDDDEIQRLAASRANAVLCPGTEGNLGDGIFRLREYTAHKGRWSIGTDSHISLNPLEDLRWLDYSQRLTSHKRNTFSDGALHMITQSFFNGKSAMGLAVEDFFSIGKALDAAVYDLTEPHLEQASERHLLSAIIYVSNPQDMRGTLINGNWSQPNY